MVCRRRLGEHGFYRRASSTVGRQWRMVEVQVQCARALGEGGIVFLVSWWSPGCAWSVG